MGVRATLLELFNPAMIASQVTTGLPAGELLAASNPSTGSPNITMAQTIPAWAVAGMNVYDVTAGKQLGVVSSGAGTTTLVMGANSANAGSGTADVLIIGFSAPSLVSGAAAGADIRGLAEIAQLRCSEAIAILNYLSTDVTLDATSAAIVSAQITALS